MECIDLFSGIGGISLALRGGVKASLYCEIDPYCQHVLAERMEEGVIERAPIHSDIKTLHISSSSKPVFVCGGFPCQDISSMGLQKGIVESERSSLFFEIMRLIDECPSVQYVFLENVANITKCGLKEVVAELTKRDFNLQWMMKSAGGMGAPHVRNRWFCLGSRTSDHAALEAMLASIRQEEARQNTWDQEVAPRVSFRPSFREDESYDENWIQRCQCLGNAVVPAVVREAFVSLASGCINWTGIMSGLRDYSICAADMSWPFPETGLVYQGRFLELPRVDRAIKHDCKITLNFNGKCIDMGNYPTPRRGITHASSLTDRSLRDLPTILVNCTETQQYLASKGVALNKEELHTKLVTNVNYIEWMMGYPKGWTRASKYKKNAIRHHGASKATTSTVEEEDAPAVAAACEPRLKRYNGMHVLMREMPGNDIKKVSAAWRNLTVEQRKSYSERASAL